MESNWLTYAKRIQSIADTGMTFAVDDFDKERYQELADISSKMLADLSNIPIGRIENLLGPLGQGYATPKVDVRGAVIAKKKKPTAYGLFQVVMPIQDYRPQKTS